MPCFFMAALGTVISLTFMRKKRQPDMGHLPRASGWEGLSGPGAGLSPEAWHSAVRLGPSGLQRGQGQQQDAHPWTDRARFPEAPACHGQGHP